MIHVWKCFLNSVVFILMLWTQWYHVLWLRHTTLVLRFLAASTSLVAATLPSAVWPFKDPRSHHLGAAGPSTKLWRLRHAVFHEMMPWEPFKTWERSSLLPAMIWWQGIAIILLKPCARSCAPRTVWKHFHLKCLSVLYISTVQTTWLSANRFWTKRQSSTFD